MSHYNTVYSIIHKSLVELHSAYETQDNKADGGSVKAADKPHQECGTEVSLQLKVHDR